MLTSCAPHPPTPTEGKVMLDYSQTRAPCDFHLPTFLPLPFPGLTSLLAQLHPDSPCFICLHGSETQQLQFPRLHRLSVRNLTSDTTSFPQLQGMPSLWSPPAALGQPRSEDPVEQDKKAGWQCQENPVLSGPASCQSRGQPAALLQA